MLETFCSGLASISTANLVSSAVICTALYLAGVAVHRLYLSPISHFPGPKLAALTWAYEFYYDWVLPGKYYERVAEMHRQYGSIVRVTPDELHILDPSYYDGVYVTAATRRTDVPYDFGLGTGFHDIARNAQSHDDHRGNYRFLKAFFSRASITRLEGLTTERLDRLDARLREWVDAAEPVNLTYAMYSYVTDIISSMLFEEPCDYLSDPGFNGSWFEKLKHGMVNVPLFAFMPWLPRIIALPLVSYLLDREKRWAVFDERTQRQQMTRRDRPSDATSTRSGKTLFDELVRQNQTKVPFDADVCREVAQFFQQAAGHNLNRTLEATITLLAMDKERQEKLRTSLEPVFANAQRPFWVELEKIPLGGGNLRRAARISPDEDLVYKGWRIPKKTPVGMTIYWMLMDPAVFPLLRMFNSERWLECSDEHLAEMHCYFVVFTKGSRSCIGNHLTYMVMYHTIAWLFRPGAPRIQLYETDESHVLSSYGLFFSLPRVDTPGVRAYLTNKYEGYGPEKLKIMKNKE